MGITGVFSSLIPRAGYEYTSNHGNKSLTYELYMLGRHIGSLPIHDGMHTGGKDHIQFLDTAANQSQLQPSLLCYRHYKYMHACVVYVLSKAIYAHIPAYIIIGIRIYNIYDIYKQ